jgi:hypothetical protein
MTVAQSLSEKSVRRDRKGSAEELMMLRILVNVNSRKGRRTIMELTDRARLGATDEIEPGHQSAQERVNGGNCKEFSAIDIAAPKSAD